MTHIQIVRSAIVQLIFMVRVIAAMIVDVRSVRGRLNGEKKK